MEIKATILFLLICVTGTLTQFTTQPGFAFNKQISLGLPQFNPKPKPLYSPDTFFKYDALSNDPNRRLDLTAHGSRTYVTPNKQQFSLGPGVQYEEPKFGGGVRVDHTFNQHTGIDANARYRIFDKPKSSLDVIGQYSQQFSPHGNGAPNFGAGLRLGFRRR